MVRRGLFIGVFGLLLSQACMVSKLERKQGPPFTLPTEQQPRIQYSAPPPARITVLEDTPEAFPEHLRDQKFSLRLNDADLNETLIALATQSGLSIVFTIPVKGSISMVLNEVPLEYALKAILKSAGYCYRIEDGIVYVQKYERKSFIVNYVYGTISSSSNSQSGTGSSSRNQSGSSSSSSNNSSADVWDDLESTLESLTSEGGTLVVDRHSGMIMMEDTSERLAMLEEFLTTFQTVANRQVLIDAKLIEVSLNEEFQMGIDWRIPRLDLGFLADGTAGSATANLASGGIAEFVLTSDHVTALLNLLGQQGQLNVLSSPRLASINNQPATISITEQIPYYTGQISTETSNIISWTVNFKQAGVVFELIPQIAEDGSIIIRLNHSISELVGYTDPVRAEPVPIIDVREATTTVRVGHGQTAIIGGLIREKFSEELSTVPVLSEIPWLGALFRKTLQVEKKTELVLLLTPYVISDSTALEEATRGAVENLNDVREGFHLGPLNEFFRKR